MAMDSAAQSVGDLSLDSGDASEALAHFCARPMCRKEFRRSTGPGRRQSYCSEICRRTAERERRQTRARLDHFESVVEQLRIDLAAFGDTATEGDGAEVSIHVERAAKDAVIRAQGIVEFASDPSNPFAAELVALVTAVAPTVLRS